MQLEESKCHIQKLEDRISAERENTDYLEMNFRKKEDELKELEEKMNKANIELKRYENNLRKTSNENNELKKQNLDL